MPGLQPEQILNQLAGIYIADHNLLGNQFNTAGGNIFLNFLNCLSHRDQTRLFTPPSLKTVDILKILDLKDDAGHDLVGNVEEALSAAAQSDLRHLPDADPLISRLKLADRGVHDWITTLSAFYGSEEQVSQMSTKRTATIEALNEVCTMAERVSSTTARRATRDLDDLIVSVGLLIDVFPEAREQHLKNAESHKPGSEAKPYYLNPGPTMSDSSHSPPPASRASTQSSTQTPSSDPHYRNRIDRVTSDDYGKMLAGNWIRDSVVYKQGMPDKGNWYNDLIARGHSCMIAGDVYGGDSPFGDVPTQPIAATTPA